jgi:hypothetical protein
MCLATHGGMQRRSIARGAVAVAVSTFFPAIAHADRCAQHTTVQRLREPDAAPTSEAAATFEDDTCVERNIFFMPGVQAVYFQPAAGLGPFFGSGVQLAPIQLSHNNDRFGPSQISMIAQVSLLKSQRVAGTMALFELGATASLERNSSRRWMIPYFGATLGGLTQSDLGTSSYAYAMGGMHLYWHHNLMLDAEGGYHFPFEDIDRGRGPRAQLSARFSLW